MKKRVLSCIQPTGNTHLGNYFGAIKNWVRLQDEYDCVFGIVDLHAMTMPYDPIKLKQNTVQMMIELLACGIDPEKAILFVQSLVPQHSELAWIFNCIASYGELTRMTQFKDKSKQVGEKTQDSFISSGLFTYPVLQAADILIYKADYVPVGKDQEQHLELSRNIAARFNGRFKPYFPEPEPLFTEIPKVMSPADPTRKMSKSLGPKHYIAIFEDEKVIRKKIRSAVTDSGDSPAGQMSPGVANLISLLKACDKLDAVKFFTEQHEAGSIRYGDLKNEVADAIVELTNGFKARKEELTKDRKQIKRMMHDLSAKAREIADQTVRDVKELTGLYNVKRR